MRFLFYDLTEKKRNANYLKVRTFLARAHASVTRVKLRFGTRGSKISEETIKR